MKGLRNGKFGPPISHLLFADDSIFFAKSDCKSVDALKQTLQLYCDGSGQKVIFSKSSIFFGPHCPDDARNSVLVSLQIENEALKDTYLTWECQLMWVVLLPKLLSSCWKECGKELIVGLTDLCLEQEKRYSFFSTRAPPISITKQWKYRV